MNVGPVTEPQPKEVTNSDILAAVQAFTKDVTGCHRTDITEIKSSITDLTSRVDTHSEQLANVNHRTGALEDDVQLIYDKVLNLEKNCHTGRSYFP